MEYIDTAILRESLLSKIKHQCEFSEIKNSLDEYIDSILAKEKSDRRIAKPCTTPCSASDWKPGGKAGLHPPFNFKQ